MASTTLTKVQFRVNLDNGNDAQGNVKTVGVSLPTLSTAGYNVNKAYAIGNALEACLTKTVYSMSEVRTSSVED